MKNKFIRAVYLLVISLYSSIVFADLMYIHYEGVVTSANNYFTQTVPIGQKEGDIVSGTLVIDDQFLSSYVDHGRWPGYGSDYYQAEGDRNLVTGYLKDKDVGRYSADQIQIVNGSIYGGKDTFKIKDGIISYLPGDKSMTAGIRKDLTISFNAPDFIDDHGLIQNFTLNEGEFIGNGSIYHANSWNNKYLRNLDEDGTGSVDFTITKITVETIEGEHLPEPQVCY